MLFYNINALMLSTCAYIVLLMHSFYKCTKRYNYYDKVNFCRVFIRYIIYIEGLHLYIIFTICISDTVSLYSILKLF